MTDLKLDSVVELDQVRFTYATTHPWTLKIKNFNLLRGEHAYVFGPSGCGKTTLLHLLAGVLEPSEGEISVLGERNLRGRSNERQRADRMGFVFQSLNLVPFLSTMENTILPCRFSKTRGRRIVDRGRSIESEAVRLLQQLGLDNEVYDRQPSQLSIGQQQRVAVARALLGSPPLIICDEPTSALDPRSRDAFLNLLLEECDHEGSTAIVVSHDPAIAHRFNRKYELNLSTDKHTTELRIAA